MKSLAILLVTICLVVVLACSDDDPVLPAIEPYGDLSVAVHVVGNVDRAMDERDFGEFEKLVSDDFEFVFTEADAASGFGERWNRLDKMTAVANVFDPNFDDPWAVDNIEFAFDTPPDGPEWTSLGDNVKTTTMGYSFEVKADQIAFISDTDARAKITVRSEGEGENQRWRLSKWEDLGGTALTTTSTARTEELSFGRLLSHYWRPLDRSERWHVLHMVEFTWDNRNIVQYDNVLDEDFTFFFSLGDVDNGRPAQWDRATEIGAARNMFDRNYSGERRITSIDIDLQFEPETVTWLEIQPQDPKYAGETWYLTTVNYSYLMEAVPDWIFLNQGSAKGQFTLRETEGTWRVVEFRDLGGEWLRSLAMSGAVAERTWGGIKALYR